MRGVGPLGPISEQELKKEEEDEKEGIPIKKPPSDNNNKKGGKGKGKVNRWEMMAFFFKSLIFMFYPAFRNRWQFNYVQFCTYWPP